MQQGHAVIPVVLSGGVGSRLWPLSRATHPKPFIKIGAGRSFIQDAYLRALAATAARDTITVTNRELFFYTKDEYAAVGDGSCFNSFILEPFGRNSAPAIAVAAQHIRRRHGNDCIMLAVAADHVITKPDAFQEAMGAAIKLAKANKLVTFGIRPDSAKTGYGYIETRGNEVIRFVEKPDAATAQQYVDAGNFLWNSGMFCMRTGALLEEYAKHAPDIAKNAEACLDNAVIGTGENWLQQEMREEDFAAMENISIDCAIMEKSENLAVVPCDLGWSDIGSWEELGKLYNADSNGNYTNGECLLQETHDCIVHSGQRLVATLGVKDLLIADTADALLVAERGQAQQVRAVVEKLQEMEHESYRSAPTVHRPWGSYTNLHEGPNFKIKRIEVSPGASLSLQSHKHRNEHWVVVRGTARIINGDQELTLQENQSTYIAAGARHRLSNPTQSSLIIVEVQCGSYLGEDDIVRYDDLYGR